MENLISEPTKISTRAFKPVAEVDIEWFEREALKKLFLDMNTTLDLETATIGKAFERVNQYVVCNMSHDVDYVADIGYYDDDSSDREIVDWRPFSGSVYIEKSVSITDFDEDFEDETPLPVFVESFIRQFRKDPSRYVEMSEIGVEPMELTEAVKEKIYKNGLKQCDFSHVKELPGDEQKNIKVTRIKETVTNEIEILASKEYVLQGEYRGRKFEAVLFACDEGKRVLLVGEPSRRFDVAEKRGVYDIRKVEGFENGWWL